MKLTSLSSSYVHSVLSFPNLSTLPLISLSLEHIGELKEISINSTVKQLSLRELSQLSSIHGIEKCQLKSFNLFSIPSISMIELPNIEKCMIYKCQSLSSIQFQESTPLTYLSIKQCPLITSCYLPKSLKEINVPFHLSSSSPDSSSSSSSVSESCIIC